MPRKPIDYSKTIIYKLVCNDLNITDVYTGHTTDFTKRKNSHKSNCNNKKQRKYNYKVYQTIRETGGFENWSMIKIEDFPCNDVYEATKRERYWYEYLNAELNTLNPNRNINEWYYDNKEILSNKAKEKYNNNKEKIIEKSIEYYKNNKEKILEYQKKWRENNKDEKAKRDKEYQKNNKAKILEKQKEKYECECGSNIRKYELSRHIKTKKHQDFIYNHQAT